jgi:membrane protease YdiL (CAAX protease family)
LNPGDPRRCPACRVANLPGARYCRGCGSLLPPPAEPPLETLATEAVLAATYPSHADAAERSWGEIRGVAWLFLMMLLLGVGLFVAQKVGLAPTTTDLARTIAVGLLALALTARAWPDLVPLLGTTGGLRGLLFAGGAFLALLGFGAVYFGAFHRLGFPTMRYTDDHVAAGWPAWSSYLLVAVGPGVTEELLFRGYVMSRLSRALTPTETLLVQSALFSLVHFSPVIFPSHFVIGLALGLVRQQTGSLYPGMLVHAAWNGRVVWRELAAAALG